MASRVTLTVKDVDRSPQLFAELKRIAHGGAFVKVGLLGQARDRRPGEELGNVEIGIVHEFGAPDHGIPERSFLRRAFDHHRREYEDLIRRLVGGIYDGKVTIEQALGVLGAKAAADIKNTVTQGDPIPPPNAPATLERKLQRSSGAAGPVRTLIDTGRLIGSISWQLFISGAKAGPEEGVR